MSIKCFSKCIRYFLHMSRPLRVLLIRISFKRHCSNVVSTAKNVIYNGYYMYFKMNTLFPQYHWSVKSITIMYLIEEALREAPYCCWPFNQNQRFVCQGTDKSRSRYDSLGQWLKPLIVIHRLFNEKGKFGKIIFSTHLQDKQYERSSPSGELLSYL